MEYKCFKCLSCGRENPSRGSNYSNKYCNNQCQQNHRKLQLAEKRVTDWLSGCGLYVWKEVPVYIFDYLKKIRGASCQVCGLDTWMDKEIPLTVTQVDGDVYNNKEGNLQLICPNCKSQKQ